MLLRRLHFLFFSSRPSLSPSLLPKTDFHFGFQAPSLVAHQAGDTGGCEAACMGDEDRKLCSVCHIWFSWSGQISRAVSLFSTRRTEPAKPRLQYLLKNMTKHLQSCKNHMAKAAVHFLYRREKK